MAVLRSLGQYLTHRGFVSRAWEVLNLEETRVSSLLLGTTAGGAGVGGAGACSSGKSVWGTSTAAGGGAGGMSTLASTSVDSQGGGGDADSAQSTDGTIAALVFYIIL